MQSDNGDANKNTNVSNSKYTHSAEFREDYFLEQVLKTLKPMMIQTSYRGKIRIQPEAVLRAYQTARLAEIVSPASCRSRQGTMHQYKSALNTLRELAPQKNKSRDQDNPFYGFMEFDFADRRKTTFYKYKAALQGHAIDLLLTFGEATIIQFWDDTFVQDLDGNKQALAAETDRRIRILYRAFNVDNSVAVQIDETAKSDLKQKAMNLRQRPHVFEEVLSAASYLTAFPPLLKERSVHLLTLKGAKEPNLRELQIENRGLTVFDIADGFEPETGWLPNGFQNAVTCKRGFGKRQLIARLNRLDKSRGDGMDWRERFFRYLESTPERGKDDKKRQAAIFTLTGCRPSELAKGIRIFLEDFSGFDGSEKSAVCLVFRILGSKCTTLAEDEEIAIFDKMNAAEKRFKGEIYGHPAHQSNQARGHEWRIVRVVSDAPEAAFLASQVLENGETVDTDFSRDPSLLDAEKMAIQEMTSGRLTHVTTVYPRKIDEVFLAVGEEDELPEEIINQQAHNIGAWISYHAGKLYPRLSGSVSPYAWRHQFASDLKAYADDPEIFARALGQRSQKTPAHYGHSSSSITKKFGHISIRTSHVVRDNYQAYPEARMRLGDNHRMI